MFFIAASNSADGVSWFDAVDFFCAFAKPTDALDNRKNTASSEIHVVEKEGLFFIKNDSNSSPFDAHSLERVHSDVRNFEGALSIACIVVTRHAGVASGDIVRTDVEIMASAVSDPNVIIPRNSGKFRIGLHEEQTLRRLNTNASVTWVIDPR